MTTQVNIHEAKTNLSRLIEAVERGEEVVIARAGKPVATLNRYVAPRRKILPPGSFKHPDWSVIPDDFDDPIDDMFDVLSDNDEDWLSSPAQQ